MNDIHLKSVLQAIEFMREHLDEELTSEQLAAHVGYSPYHFIRIFKQVTGISPRQYLSALRIETGKMNLLKESSLLVKILHTIGFQSAGSFNTRFKQFVGVSPKQFHRTSKQLISHMNEWEHQKLQLDSGEAKSDVLPRLTCRITAPSTFRGIIFVGLFPRPIPDQRPIMGTAINQNARSCTFHHIPHGTYYLLAAGIAWSLNPKDYFLLDKSLRGNYESAIKVDAATDQEVSICLREPLPQDPPIVINLPLLLFEQSKKDRAK